MLPIAIAGSTTLAPVPIVNTTLPGSAITHVPYDNVAPSISSAQVNNNTSPNSAAAAVSDQPEATQAEADTTEEQTSSAPATNAAQSPSAQATFLAQLISQDGSPIAQVILVQYEKLIALGMTKYKPSNALKPTTTPANVFGQLLQQTKPVAVQQAAPSQQVAHQQAPAPAISEEEAVLSSPVIPTPAPRPSAPQRYLTTSTSSHAPANSATQIISAYTQTASRVTEQELETAMELA